MPPSHPHFEPAQTVAGLQTQWGPAATELGSHPPATGAVRTPANATANAASTHLARIFIWLPCVNLSDSVTQVKVKDYITIGKTS